MKRTRLKRTSAKKRKEIADTSPARKAYVARVWLCECCHKRPSDQCHEIVYGTGTRHRAVRERCCWLAVCLKCHSEKLHDRKNYPLSRQLATKKYADPKHYDRSRTLEIGGYAGTFVTETEVTQWH